MRFRVHYSHILSKSVTLEKETIGIGWNIINIIYYYYNNNKFMRQNNSTIL